MSLMSILGRFLPLSLIEGGSYRNTSCFYYDRRSPMFHYASPLLRILSFRARHTSAKLVSNSEILLGLSRSLCVSVRLPGFVPLLPGGTCKNSLSLAASTRKEKVDVTFFRPFTLLAFLRMDTLYDLFGRSSQASPQSAAYDLTFSC